MKQKSNRQLARFSRRITTTLVRLVVLELVKLRHKFVEPPDDIGVPLQNVLHPVDHASDRQPANNNRISN